MGIEQCPTHSLSHLVQLVSNCGYTDLKAWRKALDVKKKYYLGREITSSPSMMTDFPRVVVYPSGAQLRQRALPSPTATAIRSTTPPKSPGSLSISWKNEGNVHHILIASLSTSHTNRITQEFNNRHFSTFLEFSIMFDQENELGTG